MILNKPPARSILLRVIIKKATTGYFIVAEVKLPKQRERNELGLWIVMCQKLKIIAFPLQLRKNGVAPRMFSVVETCLCQKWIYKCPTYNTYRIVFIVQAINESFASSFQLLNIKKGLVNARRISEWNFTQKKDENETCSLHLVEQGIFNQFQRAFLSARHNPVQVQYFQIAFRDLWHNILSPWQNYLQFRKEPKITIQ